MKRTTNKILSMTLVLLMVAGVFSVFGVAAENTIISNLSATVTEPVAGEMPNYDVENTATDAFLRQVFWWEKEDEDTYTSMKSDKTFVAGKTYACDIEYQVNGEGIYFADEVTGTINGKEVNVFVKESKIVATLMVEFVCTEAKPELTVLFTKDSFAGCGSTLTVDIEAMAELSEELMEAYLEDTVTYQWFMDGTELEGATDVSLELTHEHCTNTITVEVAYGEKAVTSEGVLIGHYGFIDAHIMDFENPVSDTATCTEDGEVTYKCKDAGCSFTTTAFSPAKGHDFGDWYETIEPDCVNDGEKERECINCGGLETEVIPSFGGHTDDDEDKICDNCGNILDGFVNPDSSYDEATKDESSIDEATKDEATKDEEKPSSDDEEKPSTDDEQKPSTDDEPKPSDPVVNKGILGDVDGNGKVNIKDATMIQKFAAKVIDLTDAEKIRADVNADTKVNVKDATAIQKFVAKIETGYSIGKPVM